MPIVLYGHFDKPLFLLLSPALSELVDLKGCVQTTDSVSCQKELAEDITAGKCWGVGRTLSAGWSIQWSGIRNIGSVEATRKMAGTNTSDTRYLISSLAGSTERSARVVQGYRAIGVLSSQRPPFDNEQLHTHNQRIRCSGDFTHTAQDRHESRIQIENTQTQRQKKSVEGSMGQLPRRDIRQLDAFALGSCYLEPTICYDQVINLIEHRFLVPAVAGLGSQPHV